MGLVMTLLLLLFLVCNLGFATFTTRWRFFCLTLNLQPDGAVHKILGLPQQFTTRVARTVSLFTCENRRSSNDFVVVVGTERMAGL